MKSYAGIGSRETPTHILELMTRTATKLTQLGYLLRSGGAVGADSAFELGVDSIDHKEIFKANDATVEAHILAEQYHPRWDLCSEYARKLHARNCMIILGRNLDQPVNFVLCWTKDGHATGGTGQAIRLASAYDIPIFNLFDDSTKSRINNMLGNKQDVGNWI